MTMRQRHQRTRDVFDTGPFGGHRTFGAIDEENGGSGQSTPEQIRYYRTYWYHVLPIRETGVSRPLILYYEWTVYNNASDVGNTEPLASGTELTDQAGDIAAQSAIDVLNEQSQQNTTTTLPKEDIVYESFRDVYYAQVVMEVITPDEGYSLAYEMLGYRAMQHASWPTAYRQGMSDYDPTNFLEQFEAYEKAEELYAAYNPGKAPNPYTAGEYLVPNVGQALLPDEKVPGSSYHYWDGNLDTHNWAWHGISTGITTGKTGDTSDTKESYPTPICDAIGGYAMSITHYIASYNEEGGFNGYRVLAQSELDGGIPAGIPIATVMQMFTKPAKTRNGKDFAAGTNFYYDTEKNPIWRKSIGMPMSPSSFFLLEPELATKNKINKISNSLITWDLIQGTHNISGEDAESTKSSGYNGVRGIFTKSQLRRRDTLNRDFGGLGFGSFRVAEKSKLPFAARVEWLGEGGEFGTYSKHPTSIPDCNGEGKTMVVYRFPRHLDPVADRVELENNNKNQMPNYDVTTATKYCYPYPGKSADKNSYALMGRLLPKGSSDDIGSDKFTTEINGEVFGGRRSIKFIPMVTPSLPPSTSHRPYHVGAVDATQRLIALSTAGQMLFDKVDRFCFDTASMKGATISVADPLKTAYFNNSMITNAYFIDRDFDVGSTAFVIGQCMLSYEMDSASIDTKLGLVDASERMILTTRYSNAFGGPINSGDVGQRSDKLQPRSPRDGTNAGKFTDDYLIPTMTMTTEDMVRNEEPMGALAVRETFKKIFGYELTPEWFGTLRLPNQDPNNPTRYIVDTDYGKFSYPYSIVGFTIPSHYNGPVLRYGEDGEPLGATDTHPGFIGKSKAYVNYQSPFGTLHRHTINFSEEIAIQSEIIDTGGSVTDVYENQTDSDSGAFGEKIEDVTQLKAETIQFEEWLRGRLMNDYGDVRFTDNEYKAYFRFWNKDYVTGRMLLEAGYTIPGINMTAYENEARNIGIPVSAAELEESEPTQVGLGAFSDASGFTITDVTAKWGAIGSASPRYTGDVGMSMVPYAADVVGEEMGYMAMSNLDGLGYPGEGIVDSALDTSKDLAMEGAKWGAISVGAPIGISAGVSIIMLAGTVVVGYMTKGALDYGFKIVGRKKKQSPNQATHS